MQRIVKPDKPAWSGPYVGGITQSILQFHEECPYGFYLYAVCGLKQPGKPESWDNLVWGDILHKGLEHALEGHPLDHAIDAMHEYASKKYPSCPSTFDFTTREMLKLYPVQATIQKWEGIDTEVKINEVITLPQYFKVNSKGIATLTEERIVRVQGKIDMLSKNRKRLGDHKCKGKVYPQVTLQELCNDIQMNLYAKMKGCPELWQYDLIQIPEEAYQVPARTRDESGEHWANRIFHSYRNTMNKFPIKDFKHLWIWPLEHTQERIWIDAVYDYCIVPMMHRLCDWWDYVTHPNFDPNDPRWFGPDFFQKSVRLFSPQRTEKYKSHYHRFITGQISYDDLVPIEGFYQELIDE